MAGATKSQGFEEFAVSAGLKQRSKCSVCSLPEALLNETEMAWADGWRATPLMKYLAANGQTITTSMLTSHFEARHGH